MNPMSRRNVHVDRGDATIKIWLEVVEVARSRGFRAHEINGILVLVEEHRTRLLEKWHEYFG